MKLLKSVGKLALIAIFSMLLIIGYTELSGTASSVKGNALENTSSESVTISKSEYDRLERYASLDEISQTVENYFYIDPDLDSMLEGAKRGLLAGLGDPYTFYYSAEEFAAMWEDDEGEYAGIGIQISASYETMLCTITRVFSNSPAAAAGVAKGDVLYKVEDLDVDATTLNDAVNIMRGKVGEVVHIQVLRGDNLLDFDIPRAVVHVNWVSSCMLDDDVGYILLYEFSGDCAETFQTHLNGLLNDGAKALIVDLRDNPGGWIDDAVGIADIFLPEETVTYLEYRNGDREYYNATEGALDIPLIVLINENSASSSEILSGALQDYGLATIIGTQSYGKGVVQFVLPVGTDGEGMQLTAALYYTPNGRSIHQVGITPDIEVELPEGNTTLYELGDLSDAQLQKAYETALGMLDGTFVPQQSDPTQAPSDHDADGTAASSGTDDLAADDLFSFRVS